MHAVAFWIFPIIDLCLSDLPLKVFVFAEFQFVPSLMIMMMIGIYYVIEVLSFGREDVRAMTAVFLKKIPEGIHVRTGPDTGY